MQRRRAERERRVAKLEAEAEGHRSMAEDHKRKAEELKEAADVEEQQPAVTRSGPSRSGPTEAMYRRGRSGSAHDHLPGDRGVRRATTATSSTTPSGRSSPPCSRSCSGRWSSSSTSISTSSEGGQVHGVTDAETVIAWPEEHRPEVSEFHAVNELQIAARREDVSNGCGVRTSGRPTTRTPDSSGTWRRLALVELGSRWRWLTFGALITSELVEFEPPAASPGRLRLPAPGGTTAGCSRRGTAAPSSEPRRRRRGSGSRW